MSRATVVCRSVVTSHSRQVVRAPAAASRFPAVRESAGAAPTVMTFCRLRTPFVFSASWISTYGGDESGPNEVYVSNEEVERLRASVTRLENDVSKQNDSVKLVEEALRNIENDGWFTPERAPRLAYLRDRPPDERQTLLMDVLRVKEEDLRKQEERLDAAMERLDAAMERLDAANEDRGKEKLAIPVAVQKEVFKFDEDCWLPQEVPVGELRKREPQQFVAEEGWLRNVTASIEERLIEEDDPKGFSRVAGIGLVRCSRGGKTRSLFEIGKWFNEHRPDVAVLFVSFSDASNVKKNEQSDPVAALCNRIAWLAHKRSNNKTLGFHGFRAKYQVDQGDVIAWLGSTRRLLLIDEINNLRGSRESVEFGDFLKENFMTREGQYFVFTSHELRTSTALLKDVIDAKSPSSRKMNICRLPVAPTLREAQLALGWPTLQTHQVIYFGRIPALLATTFLDGDLPDNQQSLIDSWAEKIETKDKQNVLFSRTMSSFFSGKSAEVPNALLPLMDSTSKDQVCWIPFYLHTFVKSVGVFALDDSVCRILTLIDEKLDEFYNSKDQSGDGWEALFVVALAMRALLGRSHKISLFDSNVASLDSPFRYRIEPVSYNEPFTGVGVEKIQDPESYIAKIPDRSKPGISIYIPSTATFFKYDVFLVVWDEEGNRSFINGYQLKKGTKTSLSSPCPLVTRSFLVKGKPPKNPRTNNRKISSEHFVATQDGGNRWIDVSEGDIESFFGVSGAFWTPNKWNELYASRK